MKQLLKRLGGTREPTAKETIAVTKTYIRAELMPVVGATLQDPVRIELPFRGRRNLSWFVTIGDRRYMLRCYLPDESEQMATHVAALRLMQQHGVSAPRLIHALESARQYGMYFATSEFVEGSGRGGQLTMTHDEVRCLAAQAAKLHSIHNEHWGGLTSPENGGYVRELMQMVERYSSRAQQHNMLSAAQRQAMAAWFRAWEPRLAAVSRFSLIHGDLHPNNVLFAGDKCTLVDTDEFMWNVPLWDVVLIYDRGCRGDAGLIKIFEKTYLPLIEEKDQKHHKEFMQFFYAFYRLRAVMRAVRLKNEKQDRITTPRALKGDLWEQLLAICGLVS
jgi:aminoglycoside phosphotransferase (APT) family kinase protein